MPYEIRKWNKFDSLICQVYSHSLFGKLFFDELSAIRLVKLKVSENNVVRVLLFDQKGFSRDANLKITDSSIRFIKESKILEEPLFIDSALFNILRKRFKMIYCFPPRSSVSVFYVAYLL